MMKGRILLIDDNLNLTFLLSRALAKEGYEVFTENNSISAVETARRVVPDLIVLDIIMPGKSGTEVLGELRLSRKLSHTPVILLTGIGPEGKSISDRYHCELLNKPVNLSALIKEIEIHLSVAELLPT